MSTALSGKVAIVTGGARGIGRATATALAEAGATVAIGDLDEAELAVVAPEVGAAFSGPLDVTDPAGFTKFVDAVEGRLGPVDILINNAGIMPVGPLHQETEDIARRMFEINVLGVITGTKRALATMLPRHTGHIINVASMAGVTSTPGAASYVGTKHAVVGFTETARLEYAGSGVEFTTVLPMFVNTDLTAGTKGLKLIKNVEPDDVAAGIVSALHKPRPRIYVPKAGGILTQGQKFVPRRVAEYVNAKMGGRTAFLDDVNHAARAEYENRLRPS